MSQSNFTLKQKYSKQTNKQKNSFKGFIMDNILVKCLFQFSLCYFKNNFQRRRNLKAFKSIYFLKNVNAWCLQCHQTAVTKILCWWALIPSKWLSWENPHWAPQAHGNINQMKLKCSFSFKFIYSLAAWAMASRGCEVCGLGADSTKPWWQPSLF